MAFDQTDKPLRLTSPHDALEAEFARINASWARRPGAITPPAFTGPYDGLGDSVRLANEARLKGEDR